MSAQQFVERTTRRRRKRFELHKFLAAIELTVFRLALTASFIYAVYRTFKHEVGQ